MVTDPTLQPVEQCAIIRLRAAARKREASLQHYCARAERAGSKWTDDDLAKEREYATVGNISLADLQALLACVDTRLAAQSSPGREGRLAAELSDTANVLENLLSADPDMPTYQADYDAAENRLVAVRAYLHEIAHPSEGGK